MTEHRYVPMEDTGRYDNGPNWPAEPTLHDQEPPRMNEHPTPWKTITCTSSIKIIDALGKVVKVWDGHYARALADRIVTAVNQHDALVAQRDELRAVCESLDTWTKSGGPTEELAAIVLTARTAIAKAGAK